MSKCVETENKVPRGDSILRIVVSRMTSTYETGGDEYINASYNFRRFSQQQIYLRIARNLTRIGESCVIASPGSLFAIMNQLRNAARFSPRAIGNINTRVTIFKYVSSMGRIPPVRNVSHAERRTPPPPCRSVHLRGVSRLRLPGWHFCEGQIRV